MLRHGQPLFFDCGDLILGYVGLCLNFFDKKVVLESCERKIFKLIPIF